MFEDLRAKLAPMRERLVAAVDVARGALPRFSLDALPTISRGGAWGTPRFQTGDKFPGGFGETELLYADYYTLRARSSQLFETNLYARGLVRRIVTNEVSTGLYCEATPREKLLGRTEDDLAEWSEDVETRFELWGQDPWLCDHMQQLTFGQLQVQARIESIVEGDVLVVLRQFAPTQLPRIQLIKGGLVQTPLLQGGQLQKGHRIVHGVELDDMGRQVAYWVTQLDGTSKRIPAYGPKSGRKLAWLVYGCDKRLDEVRGKPLLSLVLQSLREIDRYRDSTQRKAVINSMLAMFVKKGERSSSGPMLSAATRKGVASQNTGDPAAPRRFRTAEMIPGLVLDELAFGEEPIAFPSHGTDEKFGAFEEAILQTIAWTFEIPPEILLLSFSSNYSASAAAINELKMYLNKSRWMWGTNLCQPIYVEWIVAMSLLGKVTATELIESWRDPLQRDRFLSWTNADWTGNIKPNVNPVDMATAYDLMVAAGACTRDRMARELTGTKYSQNVRKLKRENEQLAEARAPILEQEAAMARASKPESKDEGGSGNKPANEEKATERLRVA